MGSVAVPQWFWLAALMLFGLAFGSFGNVVIWRLPRGESLSTPPSHCPKCETPIAWYDNVPLLGWLALRGKCRACGAPISLRYPGVELSSGILWVLAGIRFGQTPAALAAAAFLYLLLLLTLIDWDTMHLPNGLVGVLFGIGLAGALASQFTAVRVTPLLEWDAGGPLANPLVHALVGSLAGAGIVLALSLVYALIRKTQGMGMGDVKLLAAMGAFLGVYSLMALFLGTVVGAVYGVASGMRSGEGGSHKFPFGPFLAAGGAITLFVGPALWSWYARLAGIGL